MAYVTVDELREALENAGGAGARTAGTLSNPRLEANLEEAAGEVTGRLAAAFALPDAGADPTVSPEGTPALLKTIIVGIAAYLATLEFYGSQQLEERDPIQLRYTRALSLLNQLAKGQITDPGIPPQGGASPGGDPAIYGGVNVGLAEGFLEDSYGSRHFTPAHYGGMTWE